MNKTIIPISGNWSSRWSFYELIALTEFAFILKDNLWDGRPILKLRESIEGMDLIGIEYDYQGLVNGSEGRFNTFTGDQIEDSSKDAIKFIEDYCKRENIIFNNKYQPYRPTMI